MRIRKTGGRYWRPTVATALLFAVGTLTAACGDDTESSAGASDAPAAAANVPTAVKEFAEAAEAPQTEFLGGATSSPAPKKDITVGILSCAIVQPPCRRMADGAEQAAKAMGWKSIVVDGKSTETEAQAAMDSLFSRKVNAIFSAGIATAVLGEKIKKAKDLGIPVYMGSAVDPTPFGGVGAINQNNQRTGEILAAYVISQGCGGVVAFTAKEAPTVDDRVKGFKSYLEKNGGGGDCKIVEEQSIPIPDVGDKEHPIIQAILQKHPEGEVKWFVAGFDAMVRPMLQGARSIGRDEIKGVSIDADPETLDMIRADDGQVATIGVSSELIGWTAMDQLNRVLNDEPIVKADLNMRLFTKDNTPADMEFYDNDFDYRAKYKELWGVQ